MDGKVGENNKMWIHWTRRIEDILNGVADSIINNSAAGGEIKALPCQVILGFFEDIDLLMQMFNYLAGERAFIVLPFLLGFGLDRDRLLVHCNSSFKIAWDTNKRDSGICSEAK